MSQTVASKIVYVTTNPTSEIGFIITRHVNNELTNKYWREAVTCIRKFYPDYPILIIDDNSNQEIASFDIGDLIGVEIIKSEFPGAGEILAYHYFHKLHPFKKAVIIHDSIFFRKYIDFSDVEDFKPFWSFVHDWDFAHEGFELIMSNISHLNNHEELVKFYPEKNMWNGCFGIIAVITWEFLDRVNQKYNFVNILPQVVRTRHSRMSLERLIPMMFQLSVNKQIIPYFGLIFEYCNWASTYQDYLDGKLNHLPVIKVWSGR